MLIMTLCILTMSLCRHAMGGADSGIMVRSLVMRRMACLMLIGVPPLAGRLSPPAMPVHRAHKAEHREKLTESAIDFCVCVARLVGKADASCIIVTREAMCKEWARLRTKHFWDEEPSRAWGRCSGGPAACFMCVWGLVFALVLILT